MVKDAVTRKRLLIVSVLVVWALVFAVGLTVFAPTVGRTVGDEVQVSRDILQVPVPSASVGALGDDVRRQDAAEDLKRIVLPPMVLRSNE